MKGFGMAREATQHGQPKAIRFVSAKTLSEEWQVSQSTVHRLLEKAGVKPYYLHDGRNGTKRWRRDDVNEYLRSCTDRDG